jgi:hypothetical protein
MIDELDAIRLELGKLWLHFAIFRNSIPRAERTSFDKDLRAYGGVLDRLRATILRDDEVGSNSSKGRTEPLPIASILQFHTGSEVPVQETHIAALHPRVNKTWYVFFTLRRNCSLSFLTMLSNDLPGRLLRPCSQALLSVETISLHEINPSYSNSNLIIV